MANVILTMYRHYVPSTFRFSTVREAAEEAIAQLEGEFAYPDRIEIDGEIVWKSESPMTISESLEALRLKEEK